MIRRILAGAAIAAVALGFSASAASANVGPTPYNGGQAVLSQFQIIDDVLNDVATRSLNDSFRSIRVHSVQVTRLREFDVNFLNNNNNRPGIGGSLGSSGLPGMTGLGV